MDRQDIQDYLLPGSILSILFIHVDKEIVFRTDSEHG